MHYELENLTVEKRNAFDCAGQPKDPNPGLSIAGRLIWSLSYTGIHNSLPPQTTVVKYIGSDAMIRWRW